MALIGKDDMYRAMAAFPQDDYKGSDRKPRKGEWLEAHKAPLEACMEHFRIGTVSRPWPIYSNADKLYAALGRDPEGSSDPAAELAEAYAGDGLLFLPEKPRGHKKDDSRLTPYRLTGVYTYSNANPDGYHSDWLFPIHHSYGGVDVESAKLVHRGFGQMEDMLEVGHVDWDATYLPGVLFYAYDEPGPRGGAPTRRYELMERSLEGVASDAEWAALVRETLMDKLGGHGVVAMVECRL